MPVRWSQVAARTVYLYLCHPITQGTLEKPTRAMLTDIMAHLYRILSDDWEEASPTVFTTEEDLIVIYFNVVTIRNLEGSVECAGTWSNTVRTPTPCCWAAIAPKRRMQSRMTCFW